MLKSIVWAVADTAGWGVFLVPGFRRWTTALSMKGRESVNALN